MAIKPKQEASLEAEISDEDLLSDDLAWAKPCVDEEIAALERGEFISLQEHKARIAVLFEFLKQMTPAARIQATLELLEAIAATPRPADALTSAYFRSRRYMAAKTVRRYPPALRGAAPPGEAQLVAGQ